jgi:hypothetical protein
MILASSKTEGENIERKEEGKRKTDIKWKPNHTKCAPKSSPLTSMQYHSEDSAHRNTKKKSSFLINPLDLFNRTSDINQTITFITDDSDLATIATPRLPSLPRLLMIAILVVSTQLLERRKYNTPLLLSCLRFCLDNIWLFRFWLLSLHLWNPSDQQAQEPIQFSSKLQTR